MKTLLLLSAAVAFLATASALDCYACTYGDEKNECKGEGAKLDKIPRIEDPDGDSCYLCVKISYDGDKKATRGCVSKKSYKDDYRPFDVKKNKCKKNVGYDDGNGDAYDDATYCLCDSNLCNGSEKIRFSISSLVFVAIAKFFL